jgi:hypothetical protein
MCRHCNIHLACPFQTFSADTPHRGQARKSAQTAEVLRSLLLPDHGGVINMQWESKAFLATSSTPFQLVLATIRHTAVPTSSAHPWKIHPRFSAQSSRGFAPGFATLAQITRSIAITFAILSRGVFSCTKALADIVSKCGPLSNLSQLSGRTSAPGFRTWNCTFRTRPRTCPLLPYAFQRSETVIGSSGNQNHTSPHFTIPSFHMFRRHFGLFFIFLCAWGCVLYIVLYSLL